MQAGINDRSGSYDGVDNNQFFSVEQYQPAPYKVFSNENHGSINCEKAALLNSDSLKLDPFSDRPILEVNTKNNDKNDDPFADIMAPVIPSHSIALPSNILNDQSVGAKPVLPGNMAPHFSNVNTMSNCINHNVESDIQSMKPSTMSNKSEQHTDPFSDY